MANETTNQRLDIVPGQGGAVTVTITSNAGQGNDGDSLPCKMVWVQARQGNSGIIKVNIYAAATATLGITLPYAVTDAGISNGWLELPLNDVNKLYFYGDTNGDDIDIMYVK